MRDHPPLRDEGKVRPRTTRADVARAGGPIIVASAVWLVVELLGAFSKRPGDTFTEVMQTTMDAHPLAAWTLAAAWAAVCVWLVPHFVVGLDWRWLVWLAAMFVLAALGTYGLLTAGILTTP